MSSALFTLSASETQADSGVMGRMSSGAKLFHGSFTNAPKMQDSLVCLQVFDVSHDGDCSLAEVAREVTLLKRFCKQQRNIANFEGAAHDPKTETVTVVLACKNSNTLRSAILEFNFPWDLRIHICTDIVAALEAVHAAGMCHRNVSPSHILIDDKWHAYVAGFSDCVREAASPSDTGMTIVLGDAFHSPEYAMHVSQLRSTDIFSLGAVMYSLVTFESEDISDEEGANPNPNPNYSSILTQATLHSSPQPSGLAERRPIQRKRAYTGKRVPHRRRACAGGPQSHPFYRLPQPHRALLLTGCFSSPHRLRMFHCPHLHRNHRRRRGRAWAPVSTPSLSRAPHEWVCGCRNERGRRRWCESKYLSRSYKSRCRHQR